MIILIIIKKTNIISILFNSLKIIIIFFFLNNRPPPKFSPLPLPAPFPILGRDRPQVAFLPTPELDDPALEPGENQEYKRYPAPLMVASSGWPTPGAPAGAATAALFAIF